nr:MAG TPA: receptor binding protein [Caudoviricetes sp.]
MEIVTGKAGVPHVSSADDGRRIAGEVGTGSYVLQTGGKLTPSLVDANTVRFATGDMIVQGRHIGVTAPEDVKVASGSQGKKRMDYICVHYARDVSGSAPTLVETVEWTVLQGTPGTAATAPSVPKGSILDGDADVTVPVASVTFDGLTTGRPKLLIPVLTPLADLGDSVSLYESQYWSVVCTGMTVSIRAAKIIAGTETGTICPYTIPEALRPKNAWTGAMVTEYGGGDSSYRLVVMPDGTIKVHGMGGKMDRLLHFGSLSYPIGM